jgi:hypothetical protein
MDDGELVCINCGDRNTSRPSREQAAQMLADDRRKNALRVLPAYKPVEL